MTTHETTRPHVAAPQFPIPPSGRATGIVGLLTLATFMAAVLIALKQDVTTDAQLHRFLEDHGWRQALAWLLTLAYGLTWLVFVIGLRGLLQPSHGRELFTAAAIAGQAATWTGASLNTATSPPAARSVTLPVFVAFEEAGHLAMAAGTAATGLALIGLARVATDSGLWSPIVTRVTAVAGFMLIVTAVIGPISIPVFVLWLLTVSVLLLRSGSPPETGADAGAMSAQSGV